MSIGRQLGELGSSVIGTVDDLIDAYGDRAVNAADADAVAIKDAESRRVIRESQAAADIEARRNMTKLTTTAAYILLALVAALVAAQVYKSVAK